MENDIELTLLYGQPGRYDAQRHDSVDLPWATKIQSLIWPIGKRELYWQPVLGQLRGAELVIVEQANKLLVNYVLQLRNILHIGNMAFWGHGQNLQSKQGDVFSEWMKRRIATEAHWWFAYTPVVADYVQSLGYPPERITSVQNAIDTRGLTKGLQTLNGHDIAQVRRELDIRSQHVCIYVGGMYPEKRIEFLLASLMLIRAQVPDFEMIFIGSGVDAGIVAEFAALYRWVHYVGPSFHGDKIRYFAVAKLLLIPGLVGLSVLDSFALETPLVTTNIHFHSPEIEYLEDGINGVMVAEANSIRAYAGTVIHLLGDESRRQALIDNGRKAREIYTVEHMAEKFTNGVKQALKA